MERSFKDKTPASSGVISAAMHVGFDKEQGAGRTWQPNFLATNDEESPIDKRKQPLDAEKRDIGVIVGL